MNVQLQVCTTKTGTIGTDERPDMTSRQPKRGRLLVITGPSGVGKGTVIAQLLDRISGLAKSVSVTTRPRRALEADGVDYFFRSQDEFKEMIEADEFLEYAEYAGNCYGTPKKWVEERVLAGIDVIMELEVQGAMQVRARHRNAGLVFLSPPSFEALEERLRGRATETSDKLVLRLDKAKEELNEKSLFHYEVINDSIEDAVNKLVHIVYSERCRIDCGRQETL
jgi:guanylate kinase